MMILLCVLSLILAVTAVNVKRETLKRSAMDWDFILFVERELVDHTPTTVSTDSSLGWPGSVTQNKLAKNITNFVMHGMWPGASFVTLRWFEAPRAPLSSQNATTTLGRSFVLAVNSRL
jgi:hypothetical protein